MDDKSIKQRKKTAENAKKRKITPQLHDMFTQFIRKELAVECVKEYKFHPVRKWRFDYALPAYKIALEVEGGVWIQGRHTRPKGFLGDVEKYNTAALLGWRVFRCTPSTLMTSKTLKLLKCAVSGAF